MNCYYHRRISSTWVQTVTFLMDSTMYKNKFKLKSYIKAYLNSKNKTRSKLNPNYATF